MLLQAAAKKADAKTSTSAGAATTPRRKTKWIDRRSKKLIRNNGKDVFTFDKQPACALCHVRFRYQQDFAVHKETQLHKDRLKWQQMVEWYEAEGHPRRQRTEEDEWNWYVDKVLKPRCNATGESLERAILGARKAVVSESPLHNAGLEAVSVKPEIVEPRDQRWPGSKKV